MLYPNELSAKFIVNFISAKVAEHREAKNAKRSFASKIKI